MAATIIRGSDHFFTTIYEGNGKGQRVGKFVPFDDDGTIAKSCIFDKSSTGSLIRTPSSDGNKGVFTISLWFKPTTSNYGILLYASSSDDAWNSASSAGLFMEDFKLRFYSSGTSIFTTNRTFEDTSKFYHILVANDSSQSGTDKIKLYVDGDQITSFATDNRSSVPTNSIINTQIKHNIGGQTTTSTTNAFIDGYIAEFNFVDGTALTPSTFGLTDTSTGRWIPKTLTGITYGTNGYRMQFANTAGQTIGDDTSGNGNDFTVTNLVASDIVTDSPTQNHATLEGTGGTLSEGNLKLVTGNSDFSHHNATLKPSSGKYYAEFTVDVASRAEVGVASTLLLPYGSNSTRLPEPPDGSLAGYMYYGYNGRVYYNSSNSYDVTYATYTTNDVIGIALDLDNLTVQFFKNNASQGTLSIPNSNYTFAVGDGATGYNGGWAANFGQKSFSYTPPTGFVALQQDNLPTSTKAGLSDFVWIKNRDASDAHAFYDSSRGPQKEWENSESNEATVTDGLQKFLIGGFATEDNDALNTNGESYVAWNWVGNSGTEVANTDGSGATVATTVQANDTAGFSICRFQGTGSTLRFAHGLSATPEWFIVKRLDAGAGAATSVYHVYNGINKYLHLNEPDAMVDSGAATTQFTGVSSTYIQLGSNSNSNNNGSDVVAYVWRSVEGFSKFGSYTGNGNADGTFIFTGFKPAWIMIKENSSSNNWPIWDNSRFTRNPTNNSLFADLTQGDNGSSIDLDVVSNGFKCRTTNSQINRSGGTYVYMAFAEHPFHGADGITIPTAR